MTGTYASAESSSPALPTGDLTLLFTDVEGSTRLLHELGEGFAATLERHHRLLRAVFAEHGGVEVAKAGDSFFVVFESARAGVAAAGAAQRALAAEPWPHGRAVRVRMGLHTGQPVLAGDNYAGIAVHRAARIASAGHGGQVLLSVETREAVQADGVTVRDLGPHRLKDLPHPERLFQLLVDELPNDFPPVRQHDPAPIAAGLPDYSLPPADVACPYKGLAAFEADDADLFCGREPLVAEILERLAGFGFLAIVGPSGSGKSSLVRAGAVPALRAARPDVAAAVLVPGEHPLSALEAAQADAGRRPLLVVDQCRSANRGAEGRRVGGRVAGRAVDGAEVHRRLHRRQPPSVLDVLGDRVVAELVDEADRRRARPARTPRRRARRRRRRRASAHAVSITARRSLATAPRTGDGDDVLALAHAVGGHRPEAGRQRVVAAVIRDAQRAVQRHRAVARERDAVEWPPHPTSSCRPAIVCQTRA